MAISEIKINNDADAAKYRTDRRQAGRLNALDIKNQVGNKVGKM